MFWQKLLLLPIIYAFGVELLTFLTKKGHKIRCIFTSIEWIVCGKSCRRKISWKFQKKKSQKWPTQDLSNIERNKVMKNQSIWSIPRGLAYNNQPGGVDLTPPM